MSTSIYAESAVPSLVAAAVALVAVLAAASVSEDPVDSSSFRHTQKTQSRLYS
jgi:hypothetical protein